jgi:hypothetical protein
MSVVPTSPSHTALYGWAPKGERAYGGKAPRNWAKNITLIGGTLGKRGVEASMSFEGATDGAGFETYVEHFLVPTL